MLETFKSTWQAKIVILIFTIYAIIWFSLQIPQAKNTIALDFYETSYGILALLGGVWGLFTAKPWGFLKSAMGKAIVFLSLGLLAQVFGQICYTVYVYILKVPVPYPSVGDVGYFGSIPLYFIGVFYLAKVSGVRFGLKSVGNKVVALIIPLLILLGGYFLFLSDYKFDWNFPFIIFFDFGYPLGQAFYISLALLTFLLSRGVLGGIMKNKILFLLIALLSQFLSDYVFLFQVSRGTWHLGGINEFMYLISYLIMTLGILELRTIASKLQQSTS